MGIVFGITGSKEPTFQLLKSGKYEIRKYNPYFIAEVSGDNSNEEFQILAKYIGVWGNPENMLSKYILFSNCLTCLLYIFFSTTFIEQVREEVRQVPTKMEMTAPVLMTKKKMDFILPSEYKSFDQIPVPTDSRISIKEVPSQIIAVDCFSGSYNEEKGFKRMKKLCHLLQKDGLISKEPRMHKFKSDKGSSHDPYDGTEATAVLKETGELTPPSVKKDSTFNGDTTPNYVRWLSAQYHPPFTLPFLRRNEIWVELSPDNPAVQELLHREAVMDMDILRGSFDMNDGGNQDLKERA